MRFRSISLMLLSAFALAGCFDKVLDFRNAEISNGRLYEQGANEPFSGKVTNVPYFKLPTAPLMTAYTIVSNVTQDGSYRDTFFAGRLMTALALGGGGNGGLLCDLGFKKGQPDGQASCTLPHSDSPFVTMNFEQGALEGPVKISSLKNGKVTVAEARYKNNAIDGEFIVNHPETGKLLATSNWKAGKLHGPEENYSLATGKLVFKGTYVDGLIDGEAVKYSDEGAEIMRSTYQNGQLVQNIDHRANNVSPDMCVDKWIDAYRKEVGQDAIVTNDQLGEWEGWCKEGKQPT